MKNVKVAMLGYGGIAKAHKRAYERLEEEGFPIRLVAVCDIDPDAFSRGGATNLGASGESSLEGLNLYTDCNDLLENEDFDMVDICLPSYLHKEYAIKMLAAGKHVLSEKPMALSSVDCEEMLESAKKFDKKLLIGQCLRFEPSYLYLKDCIDSERFGKLKNLFMNRLSAHPMWGFEHWYQNSERSGGCIMDLHIHDVDMARFLLGEPNAVSCISYDGISRWQVVNSRFFYDDVTVIATGSWDEAATCPFQADFRARFENASVVLGKDGVTVYPDEGKPYQPTLLAQKRMDEEIRLLASMILDPTKENLTCPPESAQLTIALVEKLRESADQNGTTVKI